MVKLLWNDMIKLYPNNSTIHYQNYDWDDVVKNTTEDILKSLPELFNIKKVEIFYGDKCSNPSIIVLLRELKKFNDLITIMKNTLIQLTKVILIYVCVINT